MSNSDGPDSIQMQHVLDNIEAAVTHLQDGDLMVIKMGDQVSPRDVDNFRRQLVPTIERIRTETKRNFSVIVLTGPLEVEVMRNESAYYRLAKEQIAFRTELNEVKATIAKLINEK